MVFVYLCVGVRRRRPVLLSYVWRPCVRVRVRVFLRRERRVQRYFEEEEEAFLLGILNVKRELLRSETQHFSLVS